MHSIRSTSLALVFALAAGAAAAEPSRSTQAPRRLYGQEPDANNSFFLEAGGPGLLYSLNYERRMEEEFAVRIGFSYVGLTASASSGGSTSTASASIIAVPVTVSYLGVSSGNHFLEMGLGGTGVYASGSASGTGISASGSGFLPLGTALLGYRRQPPDGGFQFRIGLEALMGKGLALNNPDPAKFGVLPWMYMSLGFSL